jgi:hypothetical protein
VAAWSASGKGYFGELSSSQLEAELLRAAEALPKSAGAHRHCPRQRWLHVLNEAYETLGHTNLCRRWIQYSTKVRHDVIFLDHTGEIPRNLIDAVQETQGQCIVFDATTSQLQRAAQLRAYAWEEADVVVLHTHPEDVMATTAFGVAGGPPVLLVNHADHAFWVGCAVADLVLDIRTSGHLWTRQARGVDRAALLPLPLWEEDSPSEQASTNPHLKLMARKTLGIPEDAILLLTVGSEAKYQPIPSLDFVAAAQEIIKCCDKAYLIAVGPKDRGDWKAARKITGGRIVALGRQPQTKIYCQAADIYLEGFPSGSLTALLEAAQTGLPCVRSPRDCVPPFCSDGIPLEGVPQPVDVKDYVATVKSLIANPKMRVEMGIELQNLTRDHHCRGGWLTHLRDIQELVPEAHSIYPDFKSVPVEDRLRDWLLRIVHVGRLPQNWSKVTVPFFIEAWKRTNVRPLIDRALQESLNFHKPSTKTSGATERFLDRISLWRLNKKIQRRGTYVRLYSRATRELRAGKLSLARKLTYRCLLAQLSCVGKPEWLKLLIKLHGGSQLRATIGRIVPMRKS